MTEPRALCPMCPPDITCEHEQWEILELCRQRGEAPSYAPELATASDPARTRKLEQAAKRANAEHDADVVVVMRTVEGRRFVLALLERCGLFRNSFNPAAPDALCVVHAEGQRNIGLACLADVQRVAADEYLLMLQEKPKHA